MMSLSRRTAMRISREIPSRRHFYQSQSKIAEASKIARFQLGVFGRRLTIGSFMTHVVTESCIKCKFMDCVDVCPVDCFKEGPNMLIIDPDECIDCAVCIPECPVDAIYAEEDLPDDQVRFTAINAELCKVWPTITDAKAHPADADDWKEVKGKLKYLER
jgi:ferredoxin